jgi:hypothetical protein
MRRLADLAAALLIASALTQLAVAHMIYRAIERPAPGLD